MQKGKQFYIQLVLLSIFIALLFAPKIQKPQAIYKFNAKKVILHNQILQWRYAKAIESPENSALYIKNSIEFYLKRLPPYILREKHILLTNNKTIHDCLADYLKNTLDFHHRKISEGKRLLHLISPIKLLYIPDRHPSIQQGQSRLSLKIQKEIIHTINTYKIKVLFAEGLHSGKVTKERQLRIVKKKAARMGRVMSINSFESFMKATPLKYWWFPFLNHTYYKLYGIEDNSLNSIISYLVYLAQKYRNKDIYLLMSALNYVWRDQLTLSIIVKTMHKLKAAKAVLVLGEFHKQTFKTLCAHWGINLEIRRL